MDNFKFIFSLAGQLERQNFDKFFFTVFKLLPCCEIFLVSLFLPLFVCSKVQRKPSKGSILKGLELKYLCNVSSF